MCYCRFKGAANKKDPADEKTIVATTTDTTEAADTTNNTKTVRRK